jgi:hypothetical protein
VTSRLAIRIVCMVLAVVLLAASLLLALEIALELAGQPHLLVDGAVWSERGRTLAWSEASNRALAALLVLVGVGLLALAWWPRREDVIAADVHLAQSDSTADSKADSKAGTGAGPIDAPVTATVRRRDLEATLARAARRVDTVTDATVRVRRGTVRVDARTARRDVGDLRERVHAAVDGAAHRLAVNLDVAPVHVGTSEGRR